MTMDLDQPKDGDIILLVQCRAYASTKDETPERPIYVARISVARQGDEKGLDPDFVADIALQPWLWRKDATWFTPIDDGGAKTFAPASPFDFPHDVDAVQMQSRLGFPKDTLTTAKLNFDPGNVINLERYPQGTFKKTPWFSALEALGTGPGELARASGLATLMRPHEPDVLARLPKGACGFVPEFSASGVTYTPETWQSGSWRALDTAISSNKKDAICVTYAKTESTAPNVFAILMPAIAPPTKEALAKRLTEVEIIDPLTQWINLRGDDDRFETDWGIGYPARFGSAFALADRIQRQFDNVEVADEQEMLGYRDLILRLLRDQIGPGVVVAPGGQAPAFDLLRELFPNDVDLPASIVQSVGEYEQNTDDKQRFSDWVDIVDRVCGAAEGTVAVKSAVDAHDHADRLGLKAPYRKDFSEAVNWKLVREKVKRALELCRQQDVVAALLVEVWVKALMDKSPNGDWFYPKNWVYRPAAFDKITSYNVSSKPFEWLSGIDGSSSAKPLSGDPRRASTALQSSRDALAKLDPRGRMAASLASFFWEKASKDPKLPDPELLDNGLRTRTLTSASIAFEDYVRWRLNDTSLTQANAPLLQLGLSDDVAMRIGDGVIEQFKKDADPKARTSYGLVPPPTRIVDDLPATDAQAISIPFDTGHVIPEDDLFGELSGVAMIVQATSPDLKWQSQYTLNAANIKGPIADGDWLRSDAIANRPSESEGSPVRLINYDGFPLAAPLEDVAVKDDDAYAICRPVANYPANPKDPKTPQLMRRVVPQLRFGWTYTFRAFVVGHGGVLPTELRVPTDPGTMVKDLAPDLFDTSKVDGALNITYLCRVPIGAPRASSLKDGDPGKGIEVQPAGSAPLAGELPDLPTPIDLQPGTSACFYRSASDGEGEIRGFATESVGDDLEILQYGLVIAPAGELVLHIRNRAGEGGTKITLKSGDVYSLTSEGGSPTVTLDKAKSVHHLKLRVRSSTSADKFLLTAWRLGEDERLDPDLIDAKTTIGSDAGVEITAVLGLPFNDEMLLQLEATGTTPVELIPPRVFRNGQRVPCSETAGQKPSVVALDGINVANAVIRIRPPEAPFRTWERLLRSSRPLGDPSMGERIDKARHGPSKAKTLGGKEDVVDASLDHPMIEGLFYEIVEIFPERRFKAAKQGFIFTGNALKPGASDQRSLLDLVISAGKPEFPRLTIQMRGLEQPKPTIHADEKLDPKRVYEVRIYAVALEKRFLPNNGTAPYQVFVQSLADSARTVTHDDGTRYVLGAPLRLRIECAQPAFDLKGETAKAFFDVKQSKIGNPAREIEAELSYTPRVSVSAMQMRWFGAFTVKQQKWGWRGRPTPAIEGGPGWPDWQANTLLFLERSDDDALVTNRIALHAHHLRTIDGLLEPLLRAKIDYIDEAALWRFAVTFHGRYPSVSSDLSSLSYDASSGDVQVRTERWKTLLIKKGQLYGSPGSSVQNRLERPSLECWLPLTEDRERSEEESLSGLAAPILLMLPTPWHRRGDLSDKLEVVLVPARHPLPDRYEDSPKLELDLPVETDGLTQIRKYWQEWSVDPILTAKAAPHVVSQLQLIGPMGWTQSDGATSDFRRSSFLLLPVAPFGSQQQEMQDALERRPLFKVALRRISDPALVDAPQCNKAKGFSFAPFDQDNGQPEPGFLRIETGYGCGRFEGELKLQENANAGALKIFASSCSGVDAPRLLIVPVGPQKNGQVGKVLIVIKEKGVVEDKLVDVINHFPVLELPVGDGNIQLRVDISPSSLVAFGFRHGLDDAEKTVERKFPSAFDVVVSVRTDGRPWKSGMLIRLRGGDPDKEKVYDNEEEVNKAIEALWSVNVEPAGSLGEPLDQPLESAHFWTKLAFMPMRASDFSPAFWCQFGSDASSFVSKCDLGKRWHARDIVADWEMYDGQSEQSPTLILKDRRSGKVLVDLRPTFEFDKDTGKSVELVAIVSRRIVDVAGVLSEEPLFASKLDGHRIRLPSLGSGNKTELANIFASAHKNRSDLRVRLLTILKRPAPIEPSNAEAPGVWAALGDLFVWPLEGDGDPFDLKSVSSEPQDSKAMLLGISKPIEAR